MFIDESLKLNWIYWKLFEPVYFRFERLKEYEKF